jgi:pSer/pThr/pTyr-binding forkhead associated (FHA) protein
MIKFSVFFNGEPVKVYELDEPVIFIGRLPENNIPISNMGVSRRHVKIEQDQYNSYTLTDLNSLNGTLVNGKKVKKVTLCHGDKITIGKHTIIYEDGRPESVNMETIVAEVAPEEMRRIAAAVEANKNALPKSADAGQPRGAAEPAAAGGAAQSGAVLIETGSHIVYKLDRTYLSIGSDGEDDIYASGFGVSKAFAVVEQRDGGFYISVQKAMSKLKINGKSVKSHRLEHRDRIEIGLNTFRFMENG